MLAPRPSALTASCLCLAMLAAVAHCGTRTPLRVRTPASAPSDGGGASADAGTLPDGARAGFSAEFSDERLAQSVDLLLVVDNSNSMRENQANVMAQFEPMINQLVSPPCVSATNPVPHACNASDANDRPQYVPVRDLHVGVISTDLGTPGSSVPGCANSDLGDDGLLNPIRYGQALRNHEPWITAPMGFRPADCRDANQFPSFISFDSAMAAGDPNAVTRFAHDFRCNAGLYVNGCGLEQQLEAVWRALIWHDASDRVGNTDPNAGFLRADALLAILMLSDEEDGSVRDCRFARDMPCDDTRSVYDASSTRWASSNLNLRFYMYRPGSAQDPTWTLDRYIDPRDATRGFLSLKPGHPERVVFSAITGVPLEIPQSGMSINWDALLGTPGADRNDFDARDSTTAINTMSREGPISMRQANADPSCTERTVPSCRREGTTYDPTRPPCATTEQYFAWPARRIVEVARRFDEAPLCNGAPCRNGVVTSICSNNYGPTISPLVERVQNQAPSRRCIAVPLRQNTDATGRNTVDCVVRELLPPGQQCAGSAELTTALDGAGQPLTEMTASGLHAVCEVRQVPTDRDGRADTTSGVASGWYYDSSRAVCDQRLSFTTGAAPPLGTIVRIVCSPSALH